MKKQALLIGINRYQIPGSDLRGCVNDVQNLRAVLMELFSFRQRDIRTLTDLKATTSAMKQAIARLLRGAKAGDVLVLHYSGHGSNVPDDDGDEADRRDEILCPTDLDWKQPLRDDWLREQFDAVPAGVNLTVIMDCCHSGTITRAVLPPDAPIKPRFLPSPWDLVATESGRALRGSVRGQRAVLRRSAPRKNEVVTVSIPEVLVSGCRSNQTSADAYISGSYNGALTYYLVKAIRESKGKGTYREIHRRALELIKRGDYDQRPQLEGKAANLDRPFLAPLV